MCSRGASPGTERGWGHKTHWSWSGCRAEQGEDGSEDLKVTKKRPGDQEGTEKRPGNQDMIEEWPEGEEVTIPL